MILLMKYVPKGDFTRALRELLRLIALSVHLAQSLSWFVEDRIHDKRQECNRAINKKRGDHNFKKIIQSVSVNCT